MLRKLISMLGNRYAGFVLCLLVVLNLVVGSLVMHTRPDLYPSFQYLDLNFFFQPVMGVHFWLYGLLLAFFLFGVNLVACIIGSVIRLIENRAGRLKASAALLFHVALVSTMAAHLLEGIYAGTERTMLNMQGTEIAELGHVRVASMRNTYYPDGSLTDTEVTLQFDQPDGKRISTDITYNSPAIFDNGRRQVIMLRGQSMPAGVAVSRDGQEMRFMPNEPVPVRDGSLVLQRLMKNRAGVPYAQFRWQPKNAAPQQFFMALDVSRLQQAQIDVAGASYRFKEIIEAPFIIAIIRHNPALPLIFISLALATLAIFLLVGWLRTRGGATSVKAAG